MLLSLRGRLQGLNSQVARLAVSAAGLLVNSEPASTITRGPLSAGLPSDPPEWRGFCSNAEPPLPPDTHELYCALPQLAEDEKTVLDKLVAGIKEGSVEFQTVVEWLVEGNLSRQDLNYLISKGAIDEFQYKQLITQAIGGTPKLYFKEICQLVRDRHVGKDDVVWMLQEGMIVPGDIHYMVEKEHLPQDVGDRILRECEHIPKSDGMGFSDILAGIRSGKISLQSLEALVINGQLAAEDVDLLVTDGVVREEEAEKVLEDSSEEVDEALKQATAFSMLVNDKKVTFEELQMMRVRGLLGNSVIHFLVNEESITNAQGKSLLGIEEDSEVDAETIEGIDRGSPDFEALPGNDIQQKTDSAPVNPPDESHADPQQSTGPETEGAGAALDGFYPSHIDKNDIFALFEHLEETYKDIPGLPPVEEILQEAADEEKEEKKQKRLAEEAKQDIERLEKVDEKGRAYATGKRKCAVARVWIAKGPGHMTVNKKGVNEYFQNIDSRVHVTAPFIATDTLGEFNLMATVKGGGLSAQAQAIRHGISKALQNFDPTHRPTLKACGLLTRDAREVERKKPGRAKARKSFAWVKR